MFPSTAAAPAPALPSLRAALRQAAELTVAFATLESYTLDDVLPARQAGLHAVSDASAAAPSIASREVAAWEAPAEDWLAEVRPISAGARRPFVGRSDDDAAGAAAALARRPRTPRRPDARLAAAAQAGGWPVAGPHLVVEPLAVTATSVANDVSSDRPTSSAASAPLDRSRTGSSVTPAEVTSLKTHRRTRGDQHAARTRRPQRVPAEQLTLLG